MTHPLKIAFQTDVDKVRFLTRSNQFKATNVGPFVEDEFENADGVDVALSSAWAFNASEKVIVPSGAAAATVVSQSVRFVANITTSVTGIWVAEGEVQVFFSKDDGATWIQLVNEQPVASSGPSGKTVRLKALLDPESILKGWSAHW